MTQSYMDLQRQISELQEKAEMIRKKEYDSALAEVKQKIASFGFTAEELGFPAASTTGTRAKAAPKYREPDTGATWTGRGRPPRWLQAHLDAGRSRDEFRITS